MRPRPSLTALALLSSLLALPPIAMVLATADARAAEAQDVWDGLVRIKPKRMDAAWVLPGADFRPYTKVMIDPAEVAFQKDWLKNVNQSTPGVSRDLGPEDVQRIATGARDEFGKVFAETFTKAGYPVVTEPGIDVLRLSPAVINLYINAPDTMSAGRTRVYTVEAGEATLGLEARDSVTGALLGRVIDRRETQSSGSVQVANRVTNLSDFRILFRRWADISVKGLGELKTEGVPATIEPGQKLR